MGTSTVSVCAESVPPCGSTPLICLCPCSTLRVCVFRSSRFVVSCRFPLCHTELQLRAFIAAQRPRQRRQGTNAQFLIGLCVGGVFGILALLWVSVTVPSLGARAAFERTRSGLIVGSLLSSSSAV